MQITVARATQLCRPNIGIIGLLQRTHLLAIYLHTDHCLKNSCEFHNNILFPSLIQKNKPTQSATIDVTLWIHLKKDALKLQRKHCEKQAQPPSHHFTSESEQNNPTNLSRRNSLGKASRLSGVTASCSSCRNAFW